MTEADRGQFAGLMVALSETFNEPISEVRADVYFQVLRAFPLETVKAAAYQLLHGAKFFPKPAEFVEVIEGDVADQGEMALARIAEEVRRTGYYGRPRLSEDDGELVRRVWGGWEGVCAQLPARGTEAFGWERKRFLEVYSAVKAQTLREDVPALTGGQAKALLADIRARTLDVPK